MPTHSFGLELKELSETGQFSGLASVYGVVDLANDVVDAGAFTRTLADKGAERPLLWQHSAPIGICTLTDTGSGLALTGRLSLGLQAAKDAYVLLKDGVVKGLSIGFQSVRENFVGDTRHIQEVKLWEVSLVTFPCLPSAMVTSVKAARAKDISRALQELKSAVTGALEKK